MPPSSAMMVVSGWAAFHSPQVVVTTVAWLRTTPFSRSGPDTASPVKVSNTDLVTRSYITLLDRDSRPEVRRMGVVTPSGTSSVKKAWAEPHSVQYGNPIRRPPTVSLTISWISMMWRG